jgi:hypothetical protein
VKIPLTADMTHLELPDQPANLKPGRIETRGCKPKYNWTRASLAVASRIYYGEVPVPEGPKARATIKAMLTDWFAIHDEDGGPANTTLNEYAGLILRELLRKEG